MADRIEALKELAQIERSLTRAVLALAHACESQKVHAYGADYEAASAALTSLRALQQQMQGMVMVPREPTPQMWAAGAKWMLGNNNPHQVWCAMLDAATTQEQGNG